MEQLQFRFEDGSMSLPKTQQLSGVVSSGNLEILINSQPLDGACEITVSTSARGFAAIWQAVLADFHARWPLKDIAIAINDVGATPAVVSLRLDQALQLVRAGL